MSSTSRRGRPRNTNGKAKAIPTSVAGSSNAHSSRNPSTTVYQLSTRANGRFGQQRNEHEPHQEPKVGNGAPADEDAANERAEDNIPIEVIQASRKTKWKSKPMVRYLLRLAVRIRSHI